MQGSEYARYHRGHFRWQTLPYRYPYRYSPRGSWQLSQPRWRCSFVRKKRSGWNFGLPNYQKLDQIYRTHFVSHIDLERQSDRCAPTLDSSTIIISAPRSNLRTPSGFQAGKWHASKYENEILSGRSSLEAIACDNGKEQYLRTCAFHLHLMQAWGYPHLVGTSPTTTELSEILL